NEKCHKLYEDLPEEIKRDKSFEDVHDECVSHYATQSKPQMVSPQRLMSWIKREIAYQQRQETKAPPSKKQKGRPGDSLSNVLNKYMSKGATYDQHGNEIDPLR
ncbi:MAG TPA: hypothetical protein VEA37_00210, partial [Flavobacterium sp.]|nr:hypothetical protein [Flavobacterium sp.]